MPPAASGCECCPYRGTASWPCLCLIAYLAGLLWSKWSQDGHTYLLQLVWSRLSPTQFVYRSHSSLLSPFGWRTVVCNRLIGPIPIKPLHGNKRNIRANLWFEINFPTVTSQGRETYDVGTSTMCSWQASLELTGAISHKFSHQRWADLWSDWSVWWRGVILILWYWYP